MFDLLSRWHRRAEPTDQPESISWPDTEKSKWRGKQPTLDPGAISAPLPNSSPGSLTGFQHDDVGNWPYSQSSSGRASPLRSQAAWLNSSDILSDEPTSMQRAAPPPQVVRMDSIPQPSLPHVLPIARSVSSPPASPSYHSPLSSPSGPSSDETPSSRWGLRLHTNNDFSQSTQSLRLDDRPHSYNTDVFGNAYHYPLAKQLSPIPEQDYASPASARNSKRLPSVSGGDLSRSDSLARSHRTNPSPGGSQTSEITRPSPIYASPFITRQLNRTTSQTSSHLSATSSAPHLSAKSAKSTEAPSAPALDLKPSFPGHPGVSGPGPHPRPPRRATVATMPTIIASSDGHMDEVYAGEDDEISLHAESFVSASSGNTARLLSASIPSRQRAEDYDPEMGSMRSGNSRLPSASESFITRRWDREADLGYGRPRIRAKRQVLNATPAFWTFWFGFICPFLWLIGGWHFTNFGEQPPRLNFWEFYFNAGYWKEKLCLGRGKDARERRMSKVPPLPKWVAEKQLSDDGRARLNDPKRSLRGISFGYPFIPRPVRMPTNVTRFSRAGNSLLIILEKPNRLFDHLYGVKLREVRGRPESPRRMFDPWIQRCRYALCYSIFFLSIGLFTASIYLIVSNTRQLA